MKLLVLGGTVFLGRHVIDAAVRRGHEVTVFNRGNHPEVFPQLETLIGDREGNLDALAGRRWDVVIDTCGFVPGVVSASVALLADRVEHYTFVSSISVYADTSVMGLDESAEVLEGDDYGGAKAACEAAAKAAMPGRVVVVRPGLIVGPHDPTDRFTYWPRRVAHGGDVLAPAGPSRGIQWIDVRDLADWMVALSERRVTGVFNACGPEPHTMGELLEACKRVTGSDARFVWADERWLLERDVAPWVQLPLWVPTENAGMLAASNARALAEGLAFRSIDDTIRDTLEWDRGRGVEVLESCLSAAREGELLDLLQGP